MYIHINTQYHRIPVETYAGYGTCDCGISIPVPEMYTSGKMYTFSI